MLDFKRLLKENYIVPNGLIQLGVHYWQEKNVFLEAGIRSFVLVEPLPKAILRIKNKVDNVNAIIYQCAVSDEVNDNALMFCDNTNMGMSSSLLRPVKHLEKYPDVYFKSYELVMQKRIKDLHFDRTKYNILYMDIQGNELRALKGAEPEFFNHIDAIFTEINYIEMYEGCALVGELDEFLSIYGYKRIFTDETNKDKGQGDAFYIKI